MDMASSADPAPSDPAELLAAADALRDRQDWSEAAQAYAAYLRLRGGHWQIWVQYGHCLKESGDPKAALLLYREAERLQPGDADTHLQIGHALKLLGRHEEAFQEYARALTLDPGNAAARVELMAEGAGASEPPASSEAPVPPGPVTAAASPAAEAPAPAAPPAMPGPAASLALAFDASDLLAYFQGDRAPTGIQRVQMNIIEQALDRPGGEDMAAIVAFDAAGGTWKPIPAVLFRRLVALSRSGAEVADPAWAEAVAAAQEALRQGPAMEFATGGVLVNLGTSWWIPDYLRRVREAKASRGLRYVPLIYDCIPLVVPEHCAAGLVDEFACWFASVCLHADAMLAISDCTRDDVLRLQRRLLPDLALPVGVLPLDAAPLLPPGLPGTALPPRARPYVLFVATIESRKNHLLVFNAWLSLIRRHGAEAVPDLVCVGKRGWLAEAALALHANSPGLRERVALLHGVPDTELDGLYRHCLCTVFNSFYEGWGLPVTESLSHGKVPVVADNSSLRQAGGEAAVYFTPQSEPELVARLEAMIFDRAFRAGREARLPRAARLRSWAEVADQLRSEVAALLPAESPPPLSRITLHPGTAYETRLLPGPEPRLEAAIADAVREGPAWGRLKPWGVRTLQGRALLRLPLAERGALRITLEMQGQPGGGRFGLRAGRYGALEGPFRWIEASDHERLFCVLQVLDGAGDLAVEIETPAGTRLEDGRLVGPNLLGFMLCRADDLAARLDYLERRALVRMVAA
ncbi:glycosyltransferase family 1 protein [Siccirubricoccus sp. G192]|uniref:glycosyltransferase family 4 protein n=1 Tax=Siccirubricoccus sp. G192 TaxID=2849651 RepID=UPI001C2C2A97|nr:glycosyltransferase [Siccirubricoccus sp. G192]MBV1799605.1 glycosyltransferase [Siccirubricoccus sp. G192]